MINSELIKYFIITLSLELTIILFQFISKHTEIVVDKVKNQLMLSDYVWFVFISRYITAYLLQ